MNSLDYLESLGRALSGSVPAKERMEILRYYREYFEDAGPDREAEVIRELGSPEELAERIAREGGFSGGAEDAPEPGRKRGWVKWAVLAAAVCLIPIAALLIMNFAASGKTGGEVSAQPAATEELPADTPSPSADASEGGVQAAVEAFTELDVDISLGNVTVAVGDGYSVALDSSGTDAKGRAYELKYELKDGTLRVWSEPEQFVAALGESVSGIVTVTVPADARLRTAKIETSMGDVGLSGLSGGVIDAESDMGDVSARDMGDVDELDLSSSMGDVSLSGKLARKTDLETDMGAVTVNAACAAAECGYDLECSFGEVTVNGEKQTDQVTVKAPGALYELECSSSMGDIEVNFR